MLEPTPKNIQTYKDLSQNISGKGSWGKFILVCMATLIGFAILIATTTIIAASIGLGLPITAAGISTGVLAYGAAGASLGTGYAFFDSGRDTGLYKQMQQVTDDAVEVAVKVGV